MKIYTRWERVQYAIYMYVVSEFSMVGISLHYITLEELILVLTYRYTY